MSLFTLKFFDIALLKVFYYFGLVYELSLNLIKEQGMEGKLNEVNQKINDAWAVVGTSMFGSRYPCSLFFLFFLFLFFFWIVFLLFLLLLSFFPLLFLLLLFVFFLFLLFVFFLFFLFARG